MKFVPLRTVLIGAGKVAVGYTLDPYYSRWYKYSTHAEVLAAHPDFHWVATVDPSAEARQLIAKYWPGRVQTGSLAELPADIQPVEVAVITTPASIRLELLDQLPPTIEAILVEKPLGNNVAECEEFLARCCRRKILVQVNLWRRADELHRKLAHGDLQKYIGKVQGINVIYDGNLQNTATHLVDVIEMLAGPIKSSIPVRWLALNPKHYRELTVDFWGTHGRLTISQEDLHVETWPKTKHRVLRDAKEITADKPGKKITPTVGEAYYHMYTNLAQALRGQAKLFAPGELALHAARIIADMEKSARL